MVVWTRATLSRRRFDHQHPIEEMSLPVARQLILIEGSTSLFEWLVSTLFGLALALALDWHRTGCGTILGYLTYLPYLYLTQQLLADQGIRYLLL